MNLLPLLALAVVIVGFVLRVHPVLVVATAALTAGACAGMSVVELLETIGAAFLNARFLLLFALTLPVIGLLEKNGLREHAQNVVLRLRRATAGRLLIVYLFVRQLCAALGLTGLGGHAQTVRPLIAPMTQAAAERTHGPLPASEHEHLKALAAATDNVGLFFGEDIFVAFGAVLLIQGFWRDAGIAIEPLTIALWGIPTAIAAFAIHALRLARLRRRLERAVHAADEVAR
ncbi:MAG: DUF969 domain-containing protein [Planctomycetes bacterium]|nr:DUF969 domain-containing protein [Planctomycetota bacterium]MCC7170497.1 DUF969 domain-containing protein [Planctomycetota bacterium]